MYVDKRPSDWAIHSVMQQVGPNWTQVALYLGIPQTHIDAAMPKMMMGNLGGAALQALAEWSKGGLADRGKPTTWRVLLEALRATGHENVADDAEEKAKEKKEFSN